MATATHRDPRSIITPDAFEVSADLIGTPLATPRRRLAALAIDGVVIGFITLVTSSFALILGVVAALFFIRVGFKRTKVKGNVFGRAMRGSVGCLGIFIGIVTASIWSAVGFGGGDDDTTPNITANVNGNSITGNSVAGAVLTALAATGVSVAFSEAETLDEAEEAGRGFVEAAAEFGVAPDEVRSVLLSAIPEDAPWAGEGPALIDRLLPDPNAVPAEASGAPAFADDVALLVADTLRALETRIGDLQDEVDTRQAALDQVAADLAADSGGGVIGWVRARLDDLGFGFGWAALYMTVFLSWWKGQTVGKRLMGIRVVRLDGEPVTWWVAFERAGGYAAGFATGLLGFAQVWWDANRQAIHDRIVGTVVVREGAEKVVDWESAL
jgi:hypothetical protein